MPLPWFRFYSEALEDPKIQDVALTTGHPKALVLGCWVTLLAMANRSPVRGVLLLTEDRPITKVAMQAGMGVADDIFTLFMGEFQALDMIGYDEDGVCYVKNWGKRQFASDDSTKRVQEWRQRRQEEASNATEDAVGNDAETLHEHSCNTPDTDTDTDSTTPPSAAFTHDDFPEMPPREKRTPEQHHEGTAAALAGFEARAAGVESAFRTLPLFQGQILTEFYRASGLPIPATKKRIDRASAAAEILYKELGSADKVCTLLRQFFTKRADGHEPYQFAVNGPWSVLETVVNMTATTKPPPVVPVVPEADPEWL